MLYYLRSCTSLRYAHVTSGTLGRSPPKLHSQVSRDMHRNKAKPRGTFQHRYKVSRLLPKPGFDKTTSNNRTGITMQQSAPSSSKSPANSGKSAQSAHSLQSSHSVQSTQSMEDEIQCIEDELDVINNHHRHLPNEDIFFKHIFGDARHKVVPATFVKDVLTNMDVNLGDVSFERADLKVDYISTQHHTGQDTEMDFISPAKKITFLDLFFKDKDGNRYLVEMQVKDVPSMAARGYFYLARSISGSLSTGVDYQNIKRHILVIVSTKSIIENESSVHHVTKPMTKGDAPESEWTLHEEMDHIEIHNLVLDNLPVQEQEPLTPIRRWLHFIKSGVMPGVDPNTKSVPSRTDTDAAYKLAYLSLQEKRAEVKGPKKTEMLRNLHSKLNRVKHHLQLAVASREHAAALEQKDKEKAEALEQKDSEMLEFLSSVINDAILNCADSGKKRQFEELLADETLGPTEKKRRYNDLKK